MTYVALTCPAARARLDLACLCSTAGAQREKRWRVWTTLLALRRSMTPLSTKLMVRAHAIWSICGFQWRTRRPRNLLIGSLLEKLLAVGEDEDEDEARRRVVMAVARMR
jgi:hypothetical protein